MILNQSVFIAMGLKPFFVNFILVIPFFFKFLSEFLIDGFGDHDFFLNLVFFDFLFFVFVSGNSSFIEFTISLIVCPKIFGIEFHLNWKKIYFIEFCFLFFFVVFFPFQFIFNFFFTFFNKNLFGFIFPNWRLANFFVLNSDVKFYHIIISEIIADLKDLFGISFSIYSDLISESCNRIQKCLLVRRWLTRLIVKSHN